jgi:hypothetical protein
MMKDAKIIIGSSLLYNNLINYHCASSRSKAPIPYRMFSIVKPKMAPTVHPKNLRICNREEAEEYVAEEYVAPKTRPMSFSDFNILLLYDSEHGRDFPTAQ